MYSVKKSRSVGEAVGEMQRGAFQGQLPLAATQERDYGVVPAAFRHSFPCKARFAPSLMDFCPFGRKVGYK